MVKENGRGVLRREEEKKKKDRCRKEGKGKEKND